MKNMISVFSDIFPREQLLVHVLNSVLVLMEAVKLFYKDAKLLYIPMRNI